MSRQVTFFFDDGDVSVSLDVEPAQIVESVGHAWNSRDGQMLTAVTPQGMILINLGKVRAVQVR